MLDELKRFCVGVDLHGTLIEDRELIRGELTEPLIAALSAARDYCRLFICTGNDLTFVKRKIPPEILGLFDGMVLETGCVISDDQSEDVLVCEETAEAMRALEAELMKFGDRWVYKFDRRLAAIVLFTKYGFAPHECSKIVDERVRDLGYSDLAYTTYSSVAVDVIPKGYSKMSGLLRVSGGLATVGVADSMNDIQLHLGSDISFAPSNISDELRQRLLDAKRCVVELEKVKKPVLGTTYVASGSATAGTIQILEAIVRLATDMS